MKKFGKFLLNSLVSCLLISSSCNTPKQTKPNYEKPDDFKYLRKLQTITTPLKVVVDSTPITIQYQNFSEVNFDELCKTARPIPKFFEYVFSDREFLLRTVNEDFSKLEKILVEESKILGIDEQKLRELSPRESIKLCVDVTAKKLDYLDVDNNSLFIADHGKNLPTHKYLELGYGDCNRYAGAVELFFKILKEKNPKLNNVHVLNSWYGGKSIPHAWNNIIIVSKRKITVTQIDPTHYDAGEKLEAKVGYHLPESNLEFTACFLNSTFNAKEGLQLYKKMIAQIPDKKKRMRVLYEMSFIAQNLESRKEMRGIIEIANRTNSEGELNNSRYYLEILENAKEPYERKEN